MRFLNNDPKNKKPQDNKPQNGDDGRQGRRIIFLVVAALIATLLINSLYTTIANAYLSEITYNEFQDYLDKDQIAELEFQSDRMVILTRDEAKKPSAQQRLYYTGYIPNVSNDELKARLDAQGVEYNTEIVEQASPIVTFVVTWLLPVIIMYAPVQPADAQHVRRSMGGGIGGIGESKAKVYMEKSTGVTFADVAGQDEAKESLVGDHRFPAQPAEIRRHRRKAARRARCWSALRAPARRCWPRPSPARPACRSSPSPAPILSRCSSASAQAACAICSSRRRRSPRPSSSSTRSTPSASTP